MDSIYSIRQTDVSQLYDLRLRNLRQGCPIDEVHFSGDDNPDTLHFVIYSGDTAVGCASLYNAGSPLFSQEKQFQLRGMAIDEKYRSQGYGKALLLYAEWLAKNRKVNFVWLNARCDAQNFYAKSQYKTMGEPFDIPNVCKHIVMYKELTDVCCDKCQKANEGE